MSRGERNETITYFEDTLGRPPGRADDPLRDGVKMGTTLVGTPDTVIRGIQRLEELSAGGFGGLLFRAHEWANREQTFRSYELFARYVMPHFQGSLDSLERSYADAVEKVEIITQAGNRAIEAAHQRYDATHPPPAS